MDGRIPRSMLLPQHVLWRGTLPPLTRSVVCSSFAPSSAIIRPEPVSSQRESITLRSSSPPVDKPQLGAETMQVHSLPTCPACVGRDVCDYPGKREEHGAEARPGDKEENTCNRAPGWSRRYGRSRGAVAEYGCQGHGYRCSGEVRLPLEASCRALPHCGRSSSSFDLILADPPWDIHMTVSGQLIHSRMAPDSYPPQLPYGTLSDDDLRSLPIPSLQPTWGLLALWVTGRAMELARELFKAWGYRRIDEVRVPNPEDDMRQA